MADDGASEVGAAAPPPGSGRWLRTSEAAARLGVRPATLYAYVSRGLLRSHRPGGSRESWYDSAEIERLVARTRAGGRAGGLELVVDSTLTLLDPAGALSYRGLDVPRLCREAAFEDVAEWLWTGREVPAAGEPGSGWAGRAGPWRADPVALGLAAAAAALVPAGGGPADRLATAVAAIAPLDPLRHDRRPEAVASCARHLLAALVDCLPPAGAAGEVAGGSIAARLWSRLSPSAGPPAPAALAAVSGALVLLADHELPASTLAARIAASTWADPYHVVLAGLAVLSGPLHGRASEEVAALLDEAASRGPAEAVASRLRRGEPVPGFGHKVYRGPDPRAVALLGLIGAAWPGAAALADARRVGELVAAHGGPQPNVDLALGVLVAAGGLTAGAGEAIFAVARIAGWVAHAIEEYPHRLRYRPRAVYLGPQPSAHPARPERLEPVPD